MKEKNTKLSHLCTGLLKQTQNGIAPDENQICLYIEAMADESESLLLKPSDSYIRLTEYVKKLWHFRQFDQLSGEESFMYGSIWGISTFLKQKSIQQTQKLTEIDLIEKYRHNDSVLRTVSGKPGIRHKDLAKNCGKTPSALSQQLLPMIHEELLTCHIMGREKHYYLLPLGEKIYDEIEQLKSPAIKESIPFGYKMPVQTNRQQHPYHDVDDFDPKYAESDQVAPLDWSILAYFQSQTENDIGDLTWNEPQPTLSNNI